MMNRTHQTTVSLNVTPFLTFFSVQVVDIFSKLCYIMVMVYSDEAAMFKSKVSKLAGLKGLIFRSLNPGGRILLCQIEGRFYEKVCLF
jgi:hypothetical protein